MHGYTQSTGHVAAKSRARYGDCSCKQVSHKTVGREPPFSCNKGWILPPTPAGYTSKKASFVVCEQSGLWCVVYVCTL